MRVPVLVYLILSQNVLHESLQKLIRHWLYGFRQAYYLTVWDPNPVINLKSTHCFCAHMHEIMKYFLFTENQEQCLNPSYRSLTGPVGCIRPVEYHKVNAELIFAAIHAKRFDSESDIQVQVRAWSFHFDCFFDSDWNTHTEIAVIARLQGPRSCGAMYVSSEAQPG